MSKVDGTAALKPGETFTIGQRNAWPDSERWELIDGIAYGMSPAPKVPHQQLTGRFFRQLADYLEGKTCQVFIAPLDVYLPKEASDGDTVVQPDVLVVCDPAKIGEDGIHGAPDFVAEVLSDSTAYKDLTQKKQLYERCAVREYWILNPDSLSILVYCLENGKYLPAQEILKGDKAESRSLPGFVFEA